MVDFFKKFGRLKKSKFRPKNFQKKKYFFKKRSHNHINFSLWQHCQSCCNYETNSLFPQRCFFSILFLILFSCFIVVLGFPVLSCLLYCKTTILAFCFLWNFESSYIAKFASRVNGIAEGC